MGDETFSYEGGAVEPGETSQFRFPVSQTYLGDPVRIPVTIVNGTEPGPTAFLVAALHGDELNGLEVVRRVANEWDHENLAGTLVCVHVFNVPAFLAQQRYLPHDDVDLNRSFPGSADGMAGHRLADAVYRNFLRPCDFGVDFHTSTRGRTNVMHVRADMDDESVARLARAFGAPVIISGSGPRGSLRRAATNDGVPTITVEMGRAHRFQRDLIDLAVDGAWSVLCDHGMYPDRRVRWSGWRTVVRGTDEKTWLRADAGGVVGMDAELGDFVYEGDPICTITDPLETATTTVEAPFTGLIVGILENPVVSPGNPLCHLIQVEDTTRRAVEMEMERHHGRGPARAWAGQVTADE